MMEGFTLPQATKEGNGSLPEIIYSDNQIFILIYFSEYLRNK